MRCGNCPTKFCQYRRTDGECVFNSLPYGPWDKGYEPADIVRKNAEPPVSREEFERRKKVWKAHEKIVLEPFLEAAQDLVDAVEKYTRQECLRSELMIKKDKLKELLK